MTKTVQFLGKGLTRGWVPDQVIYTPGVERWFLNNVILARFGGTFDGWTRGFDMHPTSHILKTRPAAYAWYQQQDARRPIYRLEHDPDMPAACAVYPWPDVRKLFPTRRFSDSLDFQFGLALLEDFKKIELCWFPMGDRREHRRGIKTACYWIGRAEERKVEVVIHGESELLPPEKVYGYEIVYGMLKEE